MEAGTKTEAKIMTKGDQSQLCLKTFTKVDWYKTYWQYSPAQLGSNLEFSAQVSGSLRCPRIQGQLVISHKVCSSESFQLLHQYASSGALHYPGHDMRDGVRARGVSNFLVRNADSSKLAGSVGAIAGMKVQCF